MSKRMPIKEAAGALKKSLFGDHHDHDGYVAFNEVANELHVYLRGEQKKEDKWTMSNTGYYIVWHENCGPIVASAA